MKVTVLTSAQDSKYNTKSWPEQEKEVPIFSRDLPEKLWGEELHLLSWLGILHTSSASYINWKKAGAQQGVFTLWDHEKIISSCAGCKHSPPSLLEFQLWRVPKKKKKKGNRINEELLQYGWIILSELGHHCPPFCEFFQKWLSYSAITWRINPNCISCYYDISTRNTGAVAIVL